MLQFFRIEPMTCDGTASTSSYKFNLITSRIEPGLPANLENLEKKRFFAHCKIFLMLFSHVPRDNKSLGQFWC